MPTSSEDAMIDDDELIGLNEDLEKLFVTYNIPEVERARLRRVIAERCLEKAARELGRFYQSNPGGVQ
jgi:hypothetical protein